MSQSINSSGNTCNKNKLNLIIKFVMSQKKWPPFSNLVFPWSKTIKGSQINHPVTFGNGSQALEPLPIAVKFLKFGKCQNNFANQCKDKIPK